MDKKLVLDRFVVEGKVQEVYLKACDDGFIWLKLPESSYRLLGNIIDEKDCRYYLTAEVGKFTNPKLLYSVSLGALCEVISFFDYWDSVKLIALKQKKLDSFLGFWEYVLGFIKDNIDVGGLKPTYELYATDQREYGGDLLINFDIHLGDSLLLDDTENNRGGYGEYFDLGEGLISELLGKYDKDDDYMWWSHIFISFKP